MPSPSKRSGGPRSGGKLDRLRRTYSLSLEAARKMRALKNLHGMENESLEHYMFQGSELLDREQAKNLYFCIPMRFSGGVNNCSSMIYSSKDQPLSVAAIHEALDDVRQDAEQHGVVLVGKSGPHTFGAYSHYVPPNESVYHGCFRNFIFSLTKDLKVPYSGRNVTKPPSLEIYKDILKKRRERERQMYANDGEDGMEEEDIEITDEEAHMELEQLLSERGWDALFGSSDSIFFGGSDLVLTGDLSACVSSLENSYGIGLSRVDSKSLLAGAETFRLHQLEIFLVSPDDGGAPSAPILAIGAIGGYI